MRESPTAPIPLASKPDGSLPDVESFAGSLRKKLWITRGARYNASRRLQSKHNLSISTISYLSAYVLVLAALPFLGVFDFNALQRGALNVATFALSLFILTLSLLEASRNYQGRATSLHNCANEISELYDELELALASGNALTAARLREISARYHEIIRRFQDNHEPVDNLLFRVEHPADFGIVRFESVRIRLLAWISLKIPYYLLKFVLPVAILVVLLLMKGG